MSTCNQEQDFCKYFKENMTSLGLPVPDGFFNSQNAAVANAAAILSALKMIGPKATMAEIAGATVAIEKLAVLGALSASFYLGAVIGSIAVATGRYLSCGSTIADYFAMAEKDGLLTPALRNHLNQYQIVFNSQIANRKSYGEMTRKAAA